MECITEWKRLASPNAIWIVSWQLALVTKKSPIKFATLKKLTWV
jgi:hypothetical protein